MRRILLVLLALLLAVSFAPSAEAITVTISGAEVTVSYDEPTTNVDGSPLTDLKQVDLYYQWPGDASPVKGLTVPATKAAGGGIAVTGKITVPRRTNQQADVPFWGRAVDTSGNESLESTRAVQRIDFLPPGAIK